MAAGSGEETSCDSPYEALSLTRESVHESGRGDTSFPLSEVLPSLQSDDSCTKNQLGFPSDLAEPIAEAQSTVENENLLDYDKEARPRTQSDDHELYKWATSTLRSAQTVEDKYAAVGLRFVEVFVW